MSETTRMIITNSICSEVFDTSLSQDRPKADADKRLYQHELYTHMLVFPHSLAQSLNQFKYMKIGKYPIWMQKPRVVYFLKSIQLWSFSKLQ